MTKHRKACAQSAIHGIARLVPNHDAAQRDLDILFLAWDEADASTAACLSLEKRVKDLAQIYVRHTLLLPGYTNSDEYTRFERFAGEILLPMPIKATRNLIKAAIRQLDSKHNPELLEELNTHKCQEEQNIFTVTGAADPLRY